ncbi:hypothetical protein [Pseudoduganella sp. HUAS MS19]
MNPIFKIRRSEHRWSHWGDYGDVLFHGMTNHIGRNEGSLQLSRTGPFVPGLAMPGIADIIVTNSVKCELESMIRGLTFIPVRKLQIVRLNWHEWPQASAEPAEYPESGEPEDLIFGGEHDPVLAEEIGLIWELSPEIDSEIQGPGGTVNAQRYSGQHIVRADIMAGYNFISAELKNALAIAAPGCVEFVALPAPMQS